MREVDRLPAWLVEGLTEEDESDEREQRQGSSGGLWRRVSVGKDSVIVRSAKKGQVSIPIRRVSK